MNHAIFVITALLRGLLKGLEPFVSDVSAKVERFLDERAACVFKDFAAFGRNKPLERHYETAKELERTAVIVRLCRTIGLRLSRKIENGLPYDFTAAYKGYAANDRSGSLPSLTQAFAESVVYVSLLAAPTPESKKAVNDLVSDFTAGLRDRTNKWCDSLAEEIMADLPKFLKLIGCPVSTQSDMEQCKAMAQALGWVWNEAYTGMDWEETMLGRTIEWEVHVAAGWRPDRDLPWGEYMEVDWEEATKIIASGKPAMCLMKLLEFEDRAERAWRAKRQDRWEMDARYKALEKAKAEKDAQLKADALAAGLLQNEAYMVSRLLMEIDFEDDHGRDRINAVACGLVRSLSYMVDEERISFVAGYIAKLIGEDSSKAIEACEKRLEMLRADKVREDQRMAKAKIDAERRKARVEADRAAMAIKDEAAEAAILARIAADKAREAEMVKTRPQTRIVRHRRGGSPSLNLVAGLPEGEFVVELQVPQQPNGDPSGLAKPPKGHGGDGRKWRYFVKQVPPEWQPAHEVSGSVVRQYNPKVVVKFVRVIRDGLAMAQFVRGY